MKKMMIVFAAILMISAVSMAAEVKIGGKIWTQTGVNIETKGLLDPKVKKYNVTDFDVGISDLSRINATVLIYGKERGFVEIRTKGDIEEETKGNIIEQAYGTVNLGPGELLAGQSESLFDLVWGRTVWSETPLLIGWGKAWGGRIPQVRYSYGPFKVVFAKPDTTEIQPDRIIIIDEATGKTKKVYKEGVTEDIQHAVIPRIETSFTQKIGDIGSVTASALLNMTNANKKETGWDKGVTAVGAAVVGEFAVDPVNVTANVYFGQNIGFAVKDENAKYTYTARYVARKDKVYDATSIGGFVDAEIAIVKDISFCLGVGMGLDDYANIKKLRYDKVAYFADLRYKASPNMTLIFGYNGKHASLDYKDVALVNGVNVFTAYSF
ncbi:MAG: hypothetical protein QME40_06550 [bacterium]|nr:hypothetical protein [bacterium]